MPTYPHGPRLLKGAIVAIDPANPRPSTIVFQYNPEAVQRSLQPQMVGADQGQPSQTVRFAGAPVETLNVDVTIDATDQLEREEPTSLDMGIYAQLTALEMLVYPRSQQVIQNARLLAQGTLEVGPYAAPITLFIWGPNRVLPVSLTSFTIQEQAFDTRLNPIRATVSLAMRALSYSDLDSSHKGYHLFLAYQQAKETMARRGITGDPGAAIGVDVNRF